MYNNKVLKRDKVHRFWKKKYSLGKRKGEGDTSEVCVGAFQKKTCRLPRLKIQAWNFRSNA